MPLFLLHIRECFCVHAVFFPTLPFIGMTVLIPGLPVVIRYAADYGQTRKEKFQTWAGLQWSSSGASALPKQPPSSVLQFLPFTVCPGSPLLTRSPPVTCGREIGIRFCKQNRMVCCKYSINSLVYWVTYVHNVVYSFYRSMIYCYINSTQRCAGSIVIDIIPTNGADKRKFSPLPLIFL